MPDYSRNSDSLLHLSYDLLSHPSPAPHNGSFAEGGDTHEAGVSIALQLPVLGDDLSSEMVGFHSYLQLISLDPKLDPKHVLLRYLGLPSSTIRPLTLCRNVTLYRAG